MKQREWGRAAYKIGTEDDSFVITLSGRDRWALKSLVELPVWEGHILPLRPFLTALPSHACRPRSGGPRPIAKSTLTGRDGASDGVLGYCGGLGGIRVGRRSCRHLAIRGAGYLAPENIACVRTGTWSLVLFMDGLDDHTHDAQVVDVSAPAWCGIRYRRAALRSGGKSAAWRSLGGSAVKLWLELHTRFNGGNNGRLTLSYAEAAEALGMGKASVQRAYRELVEHGFLALERKGNWYSRRAHEWRLTTKPMQLARGKETATNDWHSWRPEKTKRGSETEPSASSVVPFGNRNAGSGSV